VVRIEAEHDAFYDTFLNARHDRHGIAEAEIEPPIEYRSTGFAPKTILVSVARLRRMPRMVGCDRSAALADSPKLPAMMLSSLRNTSSSSDAPLLQRSHAGTVIRLSGSGA